MPLGDFILGNRKTALRPDEMVTAIRVPKASIAGASSFQKLGARRYLVISIAMAAARVAVGADGSSREGGGRGRLLLGGGAAAVGLGSGSASG